MLSELTTLDVVFIALGAFESASAKPVSMCQHAACDSVCNRVRLQTSTRTVLPMLVIGDLCAMYLFGQKAVWSHIRKLFPPAFVA